jgi:hypothetical protein
MPSSKFPYPTEAEFQAMTGPEFESFWRTFDAMRSGQPTIGIFIFSDDLKKVIALKHAGWKPSLVYPDSSPFQWQWRRPIRPGTRDRIGHKFLSTASAFHALMRNPDIPTRKGRPVSA